MNYVGFTLLDDILNSKDIKYVRKKLNEAEARLCSLYVCNKIYEKLVELECKQMEKRRCSKNETI